jgi:hypothetical protein
METAAGAVARNEKKIAASADCRLKSNGGVMS